jgi:phage terminase large subunit GpA-like protein
MSTHVTAFSELEACMARVYGRFGPPPDMKISEWAQTYRDLPEGTTARPGKLRLEKFQIEIVDVFCDRNVHMIVIIKATQLGITDIVLFSVIGYHIHLNPQPMIYVQPTSNNAKDKGKKVITPMIRSTPVLAERVLAATSRRAGNTLRLKEFPGGFLNLAGANSAADLRSDGVPIVLFDEVDGYPDDCDGEGDPVAIASRRTDSYPDWKIAKVSTPAKPKGFSKIENEFLKSDQRYFHVPCPFCKHMQPLLWRDPETREYNMVYQLDGGGQVIRSSVAYKCRNCQKLIPEKFKWQMLDAGEWIAKFPGREIVGFYLNALMSPWRDNWIALCREWVEAQRVPEDLKTFINLRLGETWEEAGDGVEPHHLRKRAEKYAAEVPKGVGLLTAGVDVQGDRLEVSVKGWGKDEETWLIAYQQFFGDPGQHFSPNPDITPVWDQLDEFLETEFKHVSGRMLGISAVMIDSGGHHTDEVYKFVKGRQARRIFACKGSSEAGREILAKFSQNNSYRVRLYSIGTDTAKDRIFSRMKIPSAGAGYMHLPDWIEEEYLLQLTSEKRVTRFKKGKGMSREYVKTRTRNEALDLEVYALAALYSLGNHTVRRLGELAEENDQPLDPEELKEKAKADAAAQRRGGGNQGTGGSSMGGSSWVNGWRD